MNITIHLFRCIDFTPLVVYNVSKGGAIMTKKIVVAGCRNFNDYNLAKDFIDFCISDIRKKYTLIFISGGCKGADALGQRYASDNGYNVEIYPAEWEKYGKSAGPKRNKKMAEICDYVICFWDKRSRGTKSMIEYAKQFNKPIMVKIIKNLI